MLGTVHADNNDIEAEKVSMKHDGTFGVKTHQYIKVKGVVLTDKQMKGMNDKGKTTSTKKNRKRGTWKNTPTPMPSMNNILNYFGRKKTEEGKMTPLKTTVTSDNPRTAERTTPIDSEDDLMVRKLRKKNFEITTKKTFTTIGNGKNSVKKKIENYTQLARDSKNCLIGSGMCAKHNTRVQRVVKSKKMSVISKDGTVGWRFCDVTDLVCPAANSGASQVAVNDDNLSDEKGGQQPIRKRDFGRLVRRTNQN